MANVPDDDCSSPRDWCSICRREGVKVFSNHRCIGVKGYCFEALCPKHILCRDCKTLLAEETSNLLKCHNCKIKPLVRCVICKKTLCINHKHGTPPDSMCLPCYISFHEVFIFKPRTHIKQTLCCLINGAHICKYCNNQFCNSPCFKIHIENGCEGRKKAIRLLRDKRKKKERN